MLRWITLCLILLSTSLSTSACAQPFSSGFELDVSTTRLSDDAFPSNRYVLKELHIGTEASTFNIVVVPSGYKDQALDLQRFTDDWQQYVYHMFGLNGMPGSNFFTDYKRYFNVYVITGDRNSPPVPVWDADGTVKTVGELSQLRAALPPGFRCNFYNSPTCRMFLVEIRNRPSVGGSANSGRVYVGRKGSALWPNRYELAHEFGHQVIHPRTTLQDEYVVTECRAGSDRAVNIHDRPSIEKWADFIATPPIEGADNCPTGLWRPTPNSIMRDINAPNFGPLGYAVMEKGLQMRLGNIEADRPRISCDLAANEVVTADRLITCTVTDASSIRFVEFFVAKAGSTHSSLGIDFEAEGNTYSQMLDVSGRPDGDYFLRVVAWDEHFSWQQYNPRFTINAAR